MSRQEAAPAPRQDAAPALYRLLSESAAARAALGACALPLAILDAAAPARPVIYVNPAFEEFFGLAPREALGRALGTLVLRGDDALVHRLLAEPAARRTLRAWGKDGKPRMVELHSGAVRNVDGRTTHWVVAFTDQAELERLRNELDSLRTLAAAA